MFNITTTPVTVYSLLFIVNVLLSDDDVKIDEKLASLLRRLIKLNNDEHPEKVRNIST